MRSTLLACKARKVRNHGNPRLHPCHISNVPAPRSGGFSEQTEATSSLIMTYKYQRLPDPSHFVL